MTKIHLPDRINPEVVARIKYLANVFQVGTEEVISLALDALERETKAGDSLPQRVAHLEKNLAAFFDLVMTFNEKLEEKFAEANLTEKNRLKGLLKLLEIKIGEHDEAERERFNGVFGHSTGGSLNERD